MKLLSKYQTRRFQPRTSTRRTTEGTMVSFVHPNGKLGALVEVNCETLACAESVEFQLFAKWIAEHVAAAAPLAVEREQLPSDLVTRRHQTFVAEALARIANIEDVYEAERIAADIVEEKMTAFFRDVVLVDQLWNRNRELTIGALTAQVSAMSGECIRIRRFTRFHMGLA